MLSAYITDDAENAQVVVWGEMVVFWPRWLQAVHRVSKLGVGDGSVCGASWHTKQAAQAQPRLVDAGRSVRRWLAHNASCTCAAHEIARP